MKKLLPVLLLSFCFYPSVFAAQINDVGGHSSTTQEAVQEDDKTAMEKKDTRKNAEIKKLILGGPQAWLAAGKSYLDLGITKVSNTVSSAFSSDDEEEGGKGGAKKGELPEGEGMANTYDNKFKRKDDPNTASTADKAKTSRNTEVATTELATYGYAYGISKRVVAARNVGDNSTSVNAAAAKKTSSSTDLGSAVAASTATANTNAQIFNDLLRAVAITNAQRSMTVTEQNSPTNSMLDSVLTGGIGGAFGGIF
ncbi:MAG: hypothetical protein IJY92_05215 [Alphaproteobacteria bacterium]|nr:hypothetical protein [Alphaproteobacteria bacterium]